jgi:hypothetical protein
VHSREAALVVMGVPEGKLLAPMCRNESMSNISTLPGVTAELIDHSQSGPRRVSLARWILQSANGRLRRQRLPGLGTAAYRELHQGIAPQPVKVVRILYPHAIAETRCINILRIECWMRSGLRRSGIAIASLWQTPSLRSASHSQPGIAGLIASIEIDWVSCWRVEGKKRIFGHGGCGAVRFHEAVRLNTDLLRESATSRYGRSWISTADE